MDGQLVRGFAWGIVATVAMSLVMLATVVTGLSPLPEPIPKALVTTVLGLSGMPLVPIAAAGAHLLYGGVFGGLLAGASDRISALHGVALGLGLWVVALLAVFPVLGWGIAGSSLGPRPAVATLVLHLVYGAVLGLGLTSPGRLLPGTRRGGSPAE